jgi:hypothetical protein
MNRWVTGFENDGMFWVVCEDCAKKSDAPYTHEDFYGELSPKEHPHCENCSAVFDDQKTKVKEGK